MNNSIQEYCKKINRELTSVTLISIFLIPLFFLILIAYIHFKEANSRTQIVYKEGAVDNLAQNFADTSAGNPFASNKGKTYTFSWCQGASRILSKNKIIFSSEEEAKSSGRTLSKMCQK